MAKPYARLTIDMLPDEHIFLKMASAQLSMPMREFVLLATFEKMGKIDDPWLAEKAIETLKRFEEENDGSQTSASKKM